MVAGNLARKMSRPIETEIHISESPVKWCSVSLSDMISCGKRLEASVFDVEAKQAQETVKCGRYKSLPLIGEHSPVKCAYYGGRLKRNYVSKEHKSSVGFVGSSEMLDIMPKPIKFMVNSPAINDLRVSYGMILLSRSGTIGNLTFVNKTLSKLLVSEHAIRLECRDFPGYVYAFLKSKTGQLLIKANIFGSVISEIEPAHIAEIQIPDAPMMLKQRIHDLIVGSYALRDESNKLIDTATKLMLTELHLPAIQDFQKISAPVSTFDVKLSNLDLRLDASYHIPVVDTMVAHLKKYAAEVTTVGDSRISKAVILPGRFKRVYVEEGYGRVLVGGKQLGELDPSGKKYLSNTKHDKIFSSLEVHENTTLITRSGTIGKTMLVPRHWEHWVPSDHIIRVVPANKDIAGYLYIFLASDYGYPLITRYIYGSVVDEIDDNHVRQIPIPLLQNQEMQKQINALALEANAKRYEAYKLEQQALRIINDEVIYAR